MNGQIVPPPRKIQSNTAGSSVTLLSRKVLKENGTAPGSKPDVRPSFNRFGQHEPATVRIKNIITQYVGDRDGCGVEELVKELMQNSDDAKATEVHFVLDKRTLPTERVWDEWKTMTGAALCVQNNSVFTESDIESIQKLGVGSKANDPDKTGQFGIGFNVVYQLTDCPILLSDHKDVCMFDPHLRYVPGACDERPGGHIDLRQDANFAKLFPDFMAGFLRNHVEHSGCTVFRFPLRQPNVKSEVCDMSFNSADVCAMEDALQSVDFRMFIHSALLFTKHLLQVKVSIIDESGKLQEKVKVRRVIPLTQQQLLQTAHKRLSHEMKLVLRQKLKPTQVTQCSISYLLKTEDEYLKNEWFVNQTFGFYGNNLSNESAFLDSFFTEQSKKFLPTAGVAAKLNSGNMLVSLIYAFLPLPIRTGLPVHINGHFAIHSSRRSIWEHTSFGQWNRILRVNILAPAYCHFLSDLAQSVSTVQKIKPWLNMLPDIGKAEYEFEKELVSHVYSYAMEQNLAIIPVKKPNDTIDFLPPTSCLFVKTTRNLTVEQVLMDLNQDICVFPEVGILFHKCAISSLLMVEPEVVLDRLKALKLPTDLPISGTVYKNSHILSTVLDFVLDNHSVQIYNSLESSPLCLTIDSVLRTFTAQAPVFVESQYAGILPRHPEMFLHDSLSVLLNTSLKTIAASPITRFSFEKLGQLTRNTSEGMSMQQTQLIWQFVKASTRQSEVTVQLSPIMHLPLIPLNDGRFITLDQGRTILSIARASQNVQKVIKKMKLIRLEAERISTPEVTVKEINSLATPFMLNAVLPSALLDALINEKSNPKDFHLKADDCEVLLQYFNLDIGSLSSSATYCATVKSLPIFEDIDGTYKAISELQGVVLDNCIPTYGISTWMEKSNCLLLKEKSAYAQLYSAVGLARKNSVEVYLDDIFPNFSSFDEELRKSHLTSIRTSIIPLLEAYADEHIQERFWSKVKELPMIPFKGKLLPASKFRDPEVEVLSLLSDLHSLPLSFVDDSWLSFLRKAGLQVELTGDQLLTCARRVTQLSRAEFSEQKAQHILEWADEHTFSDGTLQALCDIKFLPQELIPVDAQLLELSPPVVPMDEYICLRDSVLYENDKDRHIFRHCVLCWTVVPCLPKWVKLSEKLSSMAGLKQHPTVSRVCNHIINLCEQLGVNPTSSTFKSFRKVINYCLDFLQNPCKCNKKRCDECAAVKQLKDVQFVCVKARNKRVAPSQIVLHLPSDIDSDVLYPYIFSRPSDMAKHDDLLRRIGSMTSPTPDMYAEILHHLWLDFGNRQPLQTNDKQTASLAVYGLFTSLQQQGQRLTTRPLCLPTDKAIMNLSTEIIVADNESLAKSVKDRSYEYMCSLSSCNLNKSAKELLFYLPEVIRPKLLSDLVVEDISVGEACLLDLTCPFYSNYYQRIHSKKFSQALWLLARMPEEKRGDFSNELGRLKLIDMTCFHQMTGFLSEDGKTIESTRVDKDVHVQNTIASAKLYLKHHDQYPGPAGFVGEVAAAIKSIISYKEQYYLDTGAIVHLIKCEDDDDIEQFLIEQGLYSKQDDMSRPKPGTAVPISAQELFTYDPGMIFQPKEYIGYTKKDSEMIYAKIISESPKTEGQEMKSMLREYDLDIGCGYPIQASAMDIFRESRRQDLDNYKQIVISNKSTSVPVNRSAQKAIIEEAQRTVTRLLDQVYSDPALWRQREKVKKRLLLKWHPDKAGNSSLSHEVFKHLMTELERVEAKYSLSDDEDDDEEVQVYEWDEVVTSEQITETKQTEQSDTAPQVQGDWLSAQKWIRQADHDLVCVKHLNENRIGREWACHICCEVVRKMLVACIIAKSQLTSDLESTRFTSKLYAAVSKLKGHPQELPVHMLVFSKLKVDETTTRQPGIHPGMSVPSDIFTQDITDSVIKTTQEIYDELKQFIGDQVPQEQHT